MITKATRSSSTSAGDGGGFRRSRGDAAARHDDFFGAVARDSAHQAIRRIAFRARDLRGGDEELQIEVFAERKQDAEIVLREPIGLVEEEKTERAARIHARP